MPAEGQESPSDAEEEAEDWLGEADERLGEAGSGGEEEEERVTIILPQKQIAQCRGAMLLLAFPSPMPSPVSAREKPMRQHLKTKPSLPILPPPLILRPRLWINLWKISLEEESVTGDKVNIDLES